MRTNCDNKKCTEDELCTYIQNSYICQLRNSVQDSWVLDKTNPFWYPPENKTMLSQKCELPPPSTDYTIERFHGNCQDGLFCDGVCMEKLSAGTKCLSSFQCIDNSRCEDNVCTLNSPLNQKQKTTIIVIVSLFLLISLSLIGLIFLIKRKKKNQLSRKLNISIDDYGNFEDLSSQRLSSARFSSTNQSLVTTINGDLIENGPYYGDNSDLRRYRLNSFIGTICQLPSYQEATNNINSTTTFLRASLQQMQERENRSNTTSDSSSNNDSSINSTRRLSTSTRRFSFSSFRGVFNPSTRRLSSNDTIQSVILFEDEFYDSPPPAYIS
ncbi:hypothetical protein Glove_283g112 [Diversispora epigaea]|uniref:Uncharacterized protein n=1 Tax=Diversispora epigaea TaxID=1348612 RepID=A0A397I8T0_9GLOM|nr:hypothetical protein Glove_283g112 [Diversispora epigaea]